MWWLTPATKYDAMATHVLRYGEWNTDSLFKNTRLVCACAEHKLSRANLVLNISRQSASRAWIGQNISI